MASSTGFYPIRGFATVSPKAESLENQFPVASGSILDQVGIKNTLYKETAPEFQLSFKLVIKDELVFDIPGTSAIKLALGSNGATSEFDFAVDFTDPVKIRISNLSIGLRFSKEFFKPVKPGTQPNSFEVDTETDYVEARFVATLIADVNGNIRFQDLPGINIDPFMIGDSGVVVKINDLLLRFSTDEPMSANMIAAGLSESWTGMFIKNATVFLPSSLDVEYAPSSISLSKASIGTGGFSGDITGTFNPTTTRGNLFGLSFGLSDITIGFRQNTLISSRISGTIELPFFEEPIDVEIGLNLDGGFVCKLANESGLYTLTKLGILKIEIDSLGFEIRDGIMIIKVSGQLTPLFEAPTLKWPSFRVNELSIDSNGNVHLAGGWMDLPEQYGLDFHGFKIDITKLGFGKTENGGKWIGFSGSLKLVGGLSAGGSVEGLRIIWYEDGQIDITLNGVGVEFEVPSVLRFKGSVSYGKPNGNIHRFDGDIKLELVSLDMEIDGQLVIGSDEDAGYTFFAIYLGVELPASIPLFTTGLGLYGLAGLFALQMEPDKHPDEPWYGIGTNEGWFKRPKVGVADLEKWKNHLDSLGLGAGVTIGTIADNGFTLNGRLLMVIVFPGPILMIEGKANILKVRSSLGDDSDEPLFRALAVLDGRAGSFLIGMEAQYKFLNDGELLDIGAGAEAFFSLSDPYAWHLYLGMKEPRERRIRAAVLSLFEANSYFMVDAKQLAMGAWVGFDEHWEFGPLEVAIEAWIEGNVMVSWKPAHFHGDIWLHGSVELSVFGFGLGLSVDARLVVDVFDPFHILGELSVGISLPWPLPDFDVDVSLEWGPEDVTTDWGTKYNIPPLPIPLKEIAVEHFKVTTSWPLPRGVLDNVDNKFKELLRPNYELGDGFLMDPPPSLAETEPPPPSDIVPVVPLDCRPHITFGRAVNDDGLVGFPPQPVNPQAPINEQESGLERFGWEQIGDPQRNEGPLIGRYSLQEIVLSKWNPISSAWIMVARKGAGDNPSGVKILSGSWAPIPLLPKGEVKPGSDPPVANVKLWLWSITPFDYTRHTGRAWDEWFTDHFSNYPCNPAPKDRLVCCDFEHFDIGQEINFPIDCMGNEEILIMPVNTVTASIESVDPPIEGKNHALCFERRLNIHFKEPAKSVIILVADAEPSSVSAIGFDADGNGYGPFLAAEHLIEVLGKDMRRVRVIVKEDRACVIEVCVNLGQDPAEVNLTEKMTKHLVDSMAHWSQKGEVLEPHTVYRLKVVTKVKAQGEGELAGYTDDLQQNEYAYFQTSGPPGLTDLSTPINYPKPDEFDSGLADLLRYVQQTIPATVPVAGEKPLLPRPVYRAYDVGVEFNENYVDLMYRLERRDLGLYLYNNNNRPVRDAQGRLIVLSNRWGETEDLKLTEGEDLWITVVNKSNCAALDPTIIPHNKTLTSSEEGQVLEPDSVYEARLIPLLLHEDFGEYSVGDTISGPSGALNGWSIHDDGANEGPSQWRIDEAGVPPSRYIKQLSNIWAGTDENTDPVKWGTTLIRDNNPNLPSNHYDQPGNWTDYRLSVYIRSTDNDAVGVVFRYQDASNYYRFSMDRQRKYRWLVKIIDGAHTILAEDDFIYLQDQDYLITIEAIENSLRVYQDGELVFNVSDDSLDHGRIGLYCWANVGARFMDIRVDDFRAIAPVVYRFNFTTSKFSHFFHHMHSFQNETWRVVLPADDPTDADLAAQVAQAVTPTTAQSENETRAYESLAEKVLGQPARQNPSEVQATRIERMGKALFMFVRSPEPVDWKRTSLAEVLKAAPLDSVTKVPGEVKITCVTFGTNEPNEESVSLLLRQKIDLTRHRIEYRHLPDVLAEPTGDPILFTDEFEDKDRGIVFHEQFGSNAINHYTIIDEGNNSSPSNWAVSGGHIVQTSNIYGGNLSGTVATKPGTMALTGRPSWGNMRINARLRSTTNDAIGVVFRYQDANNYYRFSMDRQRKYRRLIKKVNGTVTVLWEDDAKYNLGQSYPLMIEAYSDQIIGYLDHIFLFSIQDHDVKTGRVGLYCWANTGAHFEEFRVEAMERPPILWQPDFDNLDELKVVDETGTISGPSQWTVAGSVLTQMSNIHVVDPSPHKPGTYVLAGSSDTWQDVQISVRLRSDDDDAIGVMFRYQDANNYYRFSMDRQRKYRRLIKKMAGTVTVLWQDATQYNTGQSYDLTLRAVGIELTCYLNGSHLFTIQDSSLNYGRVALYCWANTGANFQRMMVTDQTRRIGSWTISDEGTVNVPSAWKVGNGALLQTSNIYGGTTSGADPVKPGTYAIAGHASWTDYRLIVQMRSDDNDAIGVMFRYINSDNYYLLSLDSQRSYRRLVKKENGIITTLWQDLGGYTVGQPFTLTVDVAGSRLLGYQGNARLFDVVDNSHVRGKIGLYGWANNGMRFEKVTVRKIPLEAYALFRDRFFDNDVSNWTFLDEGTVSTPSSWAIFQGMFRQSSNIYSPPNDRDTLDKRGTNALAGNSLWADTVVTVQLQSFSDDAIGLLFHYNDENNYYRFSMDRQRKYRRLVKNVGGSFTLLWEDDFAYEIGRRYKLTIVTIGDTIRGYMDGILMFLIQDNDLTIGKIGLYCWANSDARFSKLLVYPVSQLFEEWLFGKSFDFLNSDLWSFVDDGDQQGPSKWELGNDEIKQTANIFGGSVSGSEPNKPGTYAIAGDASWTDYRLIVQMRSDDDDAIGVMFRYQDANNYYRFSMDRQRKYRRLIKMIGGTVTVLWEDVVQYVLGRSYILTLDCLGKNLVGYLDGAQLFNVEDDEIHAGRFGLYCWGNTGARFSEVRLAAPIWTTYYAFGREGRFPAGTRIRVFAGNAIDAPADEPGISNRFIASLDEEGQLRLQSTTGADLRLASPKQPEGHTLRLLPDEAYGSATIKVLRNADGTGFCIVESSATPAGSDLSPGNYRLKLTYRRNNKVFDPDSQVLTEAGDSEPEQVTLDIPWKAN